MVKPQRHLHHRRRARRATRMADLGLDAAQRDRRLWYRIAIEHGAQALDLSVIAGLGASAVRLDQLNVARREPSAFIGTIQRLDLPFGAGGVDALSTTVARGGERLDDGVDAVAVAARVGKPLQHHKAHAITQHHAVRFGVERTRDVALGQRWRLTEAQEREN